MSKSDKNFLIFFIVSFGLGTVLHYLEISEINKIFLALFFYITYIWIQISNQNAHLLREVALLRSMLWQMSYDLPISKETRDAIREEIQATTKI